MKLTIPSEYAAEFVRPKRRSVDTASLRSTFEVEVREIDPADAPVAHVLGEAHPATRGEHDPKYLPFAMIDGEPVEVRIAEGDHWARRMPAAALAEACSATDHGNPFRGYYRRGGANVAAGWREGSALLPERRDEVETAANETMRKWESLRHVTASALADRAESLAVIDGWVYERVSEPTVTLVMEQGRVLVRLTEAVHDQSRFTRGRGEYIPERCIRFGVDEMDKAIGYGAALAERFGVPMENRVRVESHSPWHVRFRGAGEFLAVKGWAAMKRLSRSVGDMDPGFGKAWHDLATALYEHEAVTVPAIDAMRRVSALAQAGAVESLMEDAAMVRSLTVPGSGDGGLEYDIDQLAVALEVWDARDPQGVEWTESGLGDTAMYGESARAYEVTSLMEADALSRSFGKDFSGMAEAAGAGRGSMVAVEDGGSVRTVCFVGEGEDGKAVLEAVTSHGAEPSEAHLDLARGLVLRAVARRPSGAEMDFSKFGI